MIHDVDESLRALVLRDVINNATVDLSFEAPTKEWSSHRNIPTLNLYLYDIREDLERREVQFEEVRDEQGFVVRRGLPPRKFKLSYLVTAWTKRPEDEHRLLASTLWCFLRSDALPQDALQGALADQPDHVRVTIALPPPQDRSISDVWTALGGELKPSLDLVVTAPFVTEREQPVGPPVTEDPFIRVGDRGAPVEEVRGRRRAAAVAKESAAALAEETRRSGRVKVGRVVSMRSLPRS